MTHSPKLTRPLLGLTLVAALAGGSLHARPIGADLPWSTYEAESMRTSGDVLRPHYAPHRIEMESSGQSAVRLAAAGAYVEFQAAADANALVVRYSLPDSPDGDGTRSALTVSVNGKLVRTLALTSHFSWLYGTYPFSNRPAEGKARNFFDEIRAKDLAIAKGDVVRLERTSGDGAACTLDLVDLEDVPAPLAAPANAVSVRDFGARGDATTDDTAALRQAVAEVQARGGIVWVPAGEYRITGDILVPSSVTIQGAGMWHTTFSGDDTLYGQANRRVRFKLTGSHIRLADFAIVGRLNYRFDDEPNDGVMGAGCAESSVERIWIEHTKVGVWIYNGTNLRIEGCRFRNLLADGINLCVGTSGTVVENCTARGTGDDCFAIWPAPSDQGFVGPAPHPGNNVIRRCTGQLPFLANGGALYGGANNRIEDCLFTDIGTGCGILVSTTFLTADEQRKIDNTFTGTTVVQNCRLVRCGGYDHTWAWRAALQVCLERRSISGLVIRNVAIEHSLSDGLSVVAPGSPTGHGTLADTRLENVSIPNFGIGAPDRHGLWIREDARGGLTVADSAIVETRNDSPAFKIAQE